MKYSDRIITDAKPLPPEIQKKYAAQFKNNPSTLESTHVLTVDGERLNDFFFVDCRWLWKGASSGPLEETHIHDYGEVIGFVGSGRDDPHDLGGEVILDLGGDHVSLTKSCLIFVPPGVPHCPVRINRIDSPVFFVTLAMVKKHSRTPVSAEAVKKLAGKPPQYTIVTETKTNFSVAASGPDMPKPIPRDPSLRSTRLLHLEDDMVKGSFYVDFVWIWEGNGGAPANEHSHEWVEMIAMVGCDPQNPHDLGGTMSIVLGDETHYITQDSLVCIPAGLRHCPWKFIGIKKPTLVFSAGPSGMYTGTHKK